MTISDERFDFTSSAKKKLAILIVVGILLLLVGIFSNMGGASNGAEEHATLQSTVTNDLIAFNAGPDDEELAAVEHHETATWLKRLYTDLWINNVFFAGFGIIGLFFVTLQYVTQSAWSTGFLRIPTAMANWLPIAGVLMLVVFLLGKHDLFHWTHDYLYDKSSPEYDALLDGKKSYLNLGFYIGRMIAFFGGWTLFFYYIKKRIFAEDIEEPGVDRWKQIRSSSAWFIVFFGYSSSIGAWDWVMSIDPHWFSTLFGWYVFSSWWVSGLALISLIVIILKENGYLSIVTENHLHDLGKFVFGFTIFWAYLWFSQYMLIYYANIPEETVYFIQRLTTDQYRPVFFINLFINFVFPFLFLMTRDSKRKLQTMKVAAVIVIAGHWLDFWLMITPGVMKYDGGFGFMEIGTAFIYLGAFLWITLSNLSKHLLIAKNHPTLEESLHHHI